MNIAVIGTGYVGLVTGVCLAEVGHSVTCIDIDNEKIETLKKGISPIYEEGLTELLQKNISSGNVNFTNDYSEGLRGKELVFIAVGTPQGQDGSADLTYITAACKNIAENLQNDVIIVTKSTVPVGTNEFIKEEIESNLVHSVTIKVASNPEFLRQGSAVYDTFHGDRIVIGSDDEKALDILSEVYERFNLPIIKTDLRSAEMIKYAANAFLATKISFINEMANLSERIGANIDHVAEGIGMDHRIGRAFLNAGIGFGGSCFPKDTRALISIGKNEDYNMSILKSVVEVNEFQRTGIVERVLSRLNDLSDRKVAVLGLAFKPNTDDMREAASIVVTRNLLDFGAKVHAYDPIATENARKVLSDQIIFESSLDSAVRDADVAIILTEWKEIKEYPLEKYRENMKTSIIFDGRNCYNLQAAKQSGIEYHSIGRPVVNS